MEAQRDIHQKTSLYEPNRERSEWPVKEEHTCTNLVVIKIQTTIRTINERITAKRNRDVFKGNYVKLKFHYCVV